MAVKLTKAQRDLLERAVRHPLGNPWPLISMSERAGGAKARCFDRMKADGWFNQSNRITPAGRQALTQEQP
jgi:hypothetical protein